MKTKMYLLSGLLCDATVWEKQIPFFAEQYDVHTFDFIGFDDLTKMAEHVLAHSDEPFVLIGHSMGARVALEVTCLAPARVLKLALLNTGVHAVKEGEAEKRYALIDHAKQQGMAYLIDHWLMPMLAEHNRQQTEIIEPLSEMVLRATPELFQKQIDGLLNRPDAVSSLKNVSCPLLLGAGAHDTWAPVTQHQDMQKLAPQAQLVIFAEGGHMSQFEDAGTVNQALLEWLQTASVTEEATTN